MSELKITFLNVGQGDSTIITLPDGKTAIVVDNYKNAVKQYIDHNGLTDIAYVFLTHSDNDHASQIVTLLQNFMNATFLFYPDTLRMLDKKRVLLRKLNKLFDAGLQTDEPNLGDNWQIQDVDLEVLHPSTADRSKAWERNGDPNNTSTLLRITFAEKRALLTGDLAEKGWEAITKRKTDLKADVLKFPHHGGYYETQGDHALPKLLSQIDPSIVILSVGTTNTYNHPHPKVIEMLENHPKLSFRCTQATLNCFPKLSTPNVATPCGGNIEITFREDALDIKSEYNPAVCKRQLSK